MLQWSENLYSEYLVGPLCTIQDRAKFAENLAADWYRQRWPLIPQEELLASAVDFPHLGADGEETTTKILLHKRRVPPEALAGEAPVNVCSPCRTALWAKRPTVPKLALINDLWFGRHPPMFQCANLAHQLLLALGRVVSTKLYLSSKGADTAVRQEKESWRQKFLQYAIQGTSIVFGNGKVDQAMRSFPPEPDMVKDTFVAVFAGAHEEDGPKLSEAQQQARALKAMRTEVALQVHKGLFDEEARRLRATNYVYNDPAVCYRQDLVDDFPAQPAIPTCLEACARYVPTRSDLEDATKAMGPATSTTGAQSELDAASEDAQELTKWLSIVEDQLDDVSEVTSLPALHGMLERMESQAGRVAANEIIGVLEEGRCRQVDELGRERLRNLCQAFSAQCRQLSPGEDVAKLHSRVQALETNTCYADDGVDGHQRLARDAGTPVDDPRSTQGVVEGHVPQEARLRVPTTRKAETWWNPRYWSIARPTDFCYGDCAWGIGRRPPHGEGPEKEETYCFSVCEFIKNLMMREEMEYDVPGDAEKYRARPINRFRSSWYDVHLLHSFWRVTETTKSVLTFLKTPGAFGTARACAEVKPEMLVEVQLRMQQTGGKATVQSILKDTETPQELRTALRAMTQGTASLVGSDGHRHALRGEGQAYTLRYGPPLEFITPNLADTKQHLILIVQGEAYRFEPDVDVSYREMAQRVASDPVGQAIVFELMIRLFFVHILGLRPETVGWQRGEVRMASEQWVSDGIAADLMGVPTICGPVAAAFGAMEAQGRGSLHPHILVWLLQAQLQELLEMLQRNRTAFQNRLNRWMREVVQAVVATQHSAVTELPRYLQGGCDDTNVEVPPPGPAEKRYYCADGEVETATAEDLGVDCDTGPQDLYFYDPVDNAAHLAVMPDLPLRNNAGAVVDAESWKEEKDVEGKGFWQRPVRSSASGAFPSYRSGEPATAATSDQQHAFQAELSRQALPSAEWIREMCKDARDLVIGCGIHVCSPSCFK